VNWTDLAEDSKQWRTAGGKNLSDPKKFREFLTTEKSFGSQKGFVSIRLLDD
jgi:hypothetical protein